MMYRLLFPSWFRLVFVVIFYYTFLSEGVGHLQRLKAARDAAGDTPAVEPPEKKARDGHHQRIAEHDASTASGSAGSGSRAPPQGPLNRNLVKRWAVGKLSAKDVQNIAMDAMLQGTPGIDRFADMGARGAHDQNLFRAMRNALGNPAGAPEMDWFEVPTTAGPRTPHPFLLPQKFFSWYYAAHTTAEWRKAIAGPVGAARQFWGEIQDTPFVRNHPRMPQHLWPSTIPPWHACRRGCVQFTRQFVCHILEFPSGSGQTFRKRFLFTVLRKNEMTDATLDHALRIFAWSFNTLLGGTTPTLDPFDRPMLGGGDELAGSWRAALCQVRGDWEFYCSCFRFPRWNAAESVCFMCRASSIAGHPLSYTNCLHNAPWRATMWTDESYRAHLLANGLAVPALLRHAIGLRLDCIMPDVLHTIDLGVAAHILGNVLFIFGVWRGVYGGGNYAERVNKLAQNLDAWYKRT